MKPRMNRTSIVIILAFTIIELHAQMLPKENGISVSKDTTELKLNNKAILELQNYFEQEISIAPFARVKIEKTEEAKHERLHFNFAPNNIYLRQPIYEQIRIANFLLRQETQSVHPSHIFNKYFYCTYTINRKMKFYIKGNFDLLRLYSETLPNNSQSVYLGAGLSFKLKEQESLDLGIKYALEPKHAQQRQKWNSLMDCTLHF